MEERREHKKRTEVRELPFEDKVCPFLAAACLMSGRSLPGAAECFRIKCQLWIPEQLSCGLEVLRLENNSGAKK